jgi:predicted nucleic acid-binding protein
MAEPVETPIGAITPEHFRPGHVRHQVVVGPKFLYALFNLQDQMHAVSRAFMTFVRDGDLPYRHLIVNGHIVDEAAIRLKKQASMRNTASFLTTLDKSTVYQPDYTRLLFEETRSLIEENTREELRSE